MRWYLKNAFHTTTGVTQDVIGSGFLLCSNELQGLDNVIFLDALTPFVTRLSEITALHQHDTRLIGFHEEGFKVPVAFSAEHDPHINGLA